MSTNEWHKTEYAGSKHGWNVSAAKAAQLTQKERTRLMWRSDRYLQRCLYANRVRRKYGVLSSEAARAGWFALALLGVKPTKYQLAAHPCLERFV